MTNMISTKRFTIPPARFPADASIRVQYPINHGTWIVHPDINPRENSFCRYSLTFSLQNETEINMHVSADNRFELRCDDEYIGMGPDRCDVEHWSFHSYRVKLEPGSHTLAADVYYLYQNAPRAQISLEPGFVLYAENAPVNLNTGSAPWKATLLKGVSTDKIDLKCFCVVGPNYTIDAAAFFAPSKPTDAVVLRKAGRRFGGGNILPGWKLYPTRLPEQLRQPVGGGRVRSVSDIGDHDPFPQDEASPDTAWQAFIEDRAPVAVPPNTRTVVLWDLDQYHTAYPELTTSGGAGASVKVEWAESCFLTPVKPRDGKHQKGNRNEIAGKYFLGYGDTFLPDGQTRIFRTFWWRAGRYVRITVETGDAPLTLARIRLLETRMPLENDSVFTCSDNDFAPVVDVAARGIQMCAHDTYMDCPYYEQMMYVGDTRIQMLTSFVMSRENRLNQRALEIFDWSRRETGFVLERYPSMPRQLSVTFAMIWIMMLRDYAWWRDDADFVQERLKGMRCLLEEFKALQKNDPLLPALPGWSFIDWVDGLSFVNNPGPNESVSGVVNLLFINALNAAAELEDAFGEVHSAKYNRKWAANLAAAAKSTFWDDKRSLFADYPDRSQYSEHAQCLALLSGHFAELEEDCFDALVTADDLLRATVYFSFYLLETFARQGRGDLILDKLEFWKNMVRMGFKTPVENPEPSRSDCHGWSSHPLFHMHASLAGIRPDAPGFKTVRIQPQPGTLTQLASTVPHEAGEITLKMRRHKGQWDTTVTLPEGISGKLCWHGHEHDLTGLTEISLPAL